MIMVTVEQIRKWVEVDNLHAFYTCRPWVNLRLVVLRMDHYECQKCKARGKYTRATHVHHVNHVRDFPELALSITYIDENGVEHRQIISLCWRCHEEEHPDRVQDKQEEKEPLTPERW